MAMNMRMEEPENHIMRDSDANTAVSSLAKTLPHASKGDTINVNMARYFSLFAAFSIRSFKMIINCAIIMIAFCFTVSNTVEDLKTTGISWD